MLAGGESPPNLLGMTTDVGSKVLSERQAPNRPVLPALPAPPDLLASKHGNTWTQTQTAVIY
ncbi:hypothetical protein J6590_021065 [Homalodisca vitripennis]|nr:hypothetical protein J6590_021065 [Homalodisca vitripennis]